MQKGYRLSYHAEKVDNKIYDRALLRHLWHYLKPYKILLLSALIFLIIAKSLEAIVPYYLGQIVQEMLDRRDSGSDYLPIIIESCLWIMGILVLSYLFDVVDVLIKNWVGQKAVFDLRNKVYDHIVHMPLTYFDKNAVGRLMTRTIHDIDQINLMLAENLVPLIGNLVLFIGIFIGIIILDWRVAIVALILFPFAYFHTNYFRINQRRCYDLIRSIVAAMNSFVQEHLMGVSTIRNFGLQRRERDRFQEINEDHATAYKETIHYFALFYAGIDLLQSSSLIAAFTMLVLFAPAGTAFEAGTFFTFSLYALMVFRPLADIAERYNELQAAMAASEKVFNVLEKPTEVQKGEHKALITIEEIAFENVWFAYKEEQWVLKGLSFKIKKGESIAIVGPTGAGKTSILSLLLRFYDFQKGNITINGVDIRKYPLDELRRQFSMVLQDPVIFSGTIADNISLGSSGISPGTIEMVIDRLHMRPFLQRFPDGLKHHLSERGQSLSVGEMQLISMARALAHQRSVFLLDEATANIDSGTEKIIQDALKYMIQESTSIIVAHRLSTIKDVSRIIVLYDGTVAEEGTHDSLLAAKGIYEKLYRLQFQN